MQWARKWHCHFIEQTSELSPTDCMKSHLKRDQTHWTDVNAVKEHFIYQWYQKQRIDRSRRMRVPTFPLSLELIMWLWPESSAVSVEWYFWWEDCKGWYGLCNEVPTLVNSNYFFQVLGNEIESRDWVISIQPIMAWVKLAAWKQASARKSLTTDVMIRPKTSKYFSEG